MQIIKEWHKLILEEWLTFDRSMMGQTERQTQHRDKDNTALTFYNVLNIQAHS